MNVTLAYDNEGTITGGSEDVGYFRTVKNINNVSDRCSLGDTGKSSPLSAAESPPSRPHVKRRLYKGASVMIIVVPFVERSRKVNQFFGVDMARRVSVYSNVTYSSP
jgi:hypothetical protein